MEIDDNNQYESTLAYCRVVLRVSDGQEILFNMTGRTKLMSLAMYKIAAEHGNVAVLYRVMPKDGAKDYASLLKWLLCEDKKDLWYSNYNAADELDIDDFLALGGATGCTMKNGRFCHDMDNKFFTRGWREVLMADYLSSGKKNSVIRCSVETKVCDDKRTEIDVLATDGFSLTCYSCKTFLKAPDSEIQKHKSRGKARGGTKCIFGVSVYACHPDALDSLREFASAPEAKMTAGREMFPSDRVLTVQRKKRRPGPRNLPKYSKTCSYLNFTL